MSDTLTPNHVRDAHVCVPILKSGEFFDIPAMMPAPKPSRLQESAPYYVLQKTADNTHYIINPDEERLCGTFNFLILKRASESGSLDTLELYISKKSHGFIAMEQVATNATVVSAGEIQTDSHGKITRMSDQSGNYYVPNTEPDFKERRASAKKAMDAFGLPMHLFQHFNKEWLTFSTLALKTRMEETQKTYLLKNR